MTRSRTFELHYRLHWHRPGGGFRATLEPGTLQVGPILLNRYRAPESAPAVELARIGQGYAVVDDDTGEETTGWHRDWVGMAFRFGWSIGVPEPSRVGRLIERLDVWLRVRRNRRRYGRGVDGPGVSLGSTFPEVATLRPVLVMSSPDTDAEVASRYEAP